MTKQIEPTGDIPIPYMTDDDEPQNFAEALAITANTSEFLEALDGPPEIDPDDLAKTKSLLQKAVKNQDEKALNNPMTAFAAREFLRVYSGRLAADVSDVRAALTNKLMELANCGDPRFELKALELLCKHSDIGLFTERSEVTVTYKNAGDLESAIKEKVKRLLNSDVVDVEPIAPKADDLDEEFGPPIDRSKDD